MILKLKKESDGKWMFGVYRGKGLLRNKGGGLRITEQGKRSF